MVPELGMAYTIVILSLEFSMKHTRLISTGLVNVPGLFAWTQNMYRSPKKTDKAQAVEIWSQSFGLGPKTSEALLAGFLKVTINAPEGWMEFLVEDRTF
jgi:hypothetical protein